MLSTDYRVDGMTCEHCVSAVTRQLLAVGGVNAVTVDLQSGGASTVTVTSPDRLRDEQVAAALEEAGGYHLVGADS
ncbi:MAG: heavy-metal-associated domain-containing protein [Allobranchiibius sp.]